MTRPKDARLSDLNTADQSPELVTLENFQLKDGDGEHFEALVGVDCVTVASVSLTLDNLEDLKLIVQAHTDSVRVSGFTGAA